MASVQATVVMMAVQNSCILAERLFRIHEGGSAVDLRMQLAGLKVDIGLVALGRHKRRQTGDHGGYIIGSPPTVNQKDIFAKHSNRFPFLFCFSFLSLALISLLPNCP